MSRDLAKPRPERPRGGSRSTGWRSSRTAVVDGPGEPRRHPGTRAARPGQRARRTPRRRAGRLPGRPHRPGPADPRTRRPRGRRRPGRRPPMSGTPSTRARAAGVPVTAVDDTQRTRTRTPSRTVRPSSGLMIPASMGLRFQVPADLDAFTVVRRGASTSRSHRTSDQRRPRSRRYQRTPVEIPTTVTVADLPPGETRPYPLQDEVVLRIDRYDDPSAGARLIEVGPVQRPGDPAEDPGRRLAVPDPARRRRRRRGRVPAGQRRPRDPRRARRRAAPAAAAVPRPAGVRRRAHLLGRLGRRTRGPARHRVWTTWLPTVETPQTAAEEVEARCSTCTCSPWPMPRRAGAGLDADRHRLSRVARRRSASVAAAAARAPARRGARRGRRGAQVARAARRTAWRICSS